MAKLPLLAALLVAGSALAEPGRWALAIGENRGLQGEEPLRFAEEDARRMLQTLRELGGVPEEQAMLVAGADAATVREALLQLEARIAARGEQQERLYLYVSSHAGNGVLHLRHTELPLSEVVDFLGRLPVSVGVLVVDACRSGTVTGAKGLRPLEERVRVMQAAPLEGRILISASGADELAQESDVLGGSYFTHHLITGLRGAADSSADGRVTLDEAYRWAWARTVESTFSTTGGVQTPRFKFDLRGQGELVLTDLSQAESRITLNVERPGRWLLVRAEDGLIAADVEKPRGPLSLAVPPGRYRVRLRVDGGFLEKDLLVEASQHRTLHEAELDSASLVRVALKGRDTPLYVLSASATVASPLVGSLASAPGVDLRLRLERDWLGPINQLAFGFKGHDAFSATFGFRQSELELRAGAGRHWDWSRVALSAGLDLGAILIRQSALPDGSERTSLGPLLAAVAELRVHLLGPLDLVVNGNGGPALLKKTRGVTPAWRAAAAAGLAVSF